MSPRAKRAYTLLEVVAASTLFVFVMTLLAGTVSTVLSSRVAMRTAQDLDDTLSTIVDQVSSNDYAVLLSNSFTPPDVCAGDPTDSGSLASSCVQINGQPVVISYQVTPGPDSASLYGAPADSADYLSLVVTATRPDGSNARRTKVISAPAPGFKEDHGLLRVSMTGDYSSLDTPLILLGGPSQDTVVAAALPDGSATVLLRASLDFCDTSEPCALVLSDGSDNMPHGISGSRLQQIVLDSARVTDSSIRVSERPHLVLTIDATNQTSKRHVQTDTRPNQSSVCVWLSFYDSGPQVTSACNTSESGRAISVSSYTKPGAQDQTPLPTGVPITIHADNPDYDTCVTPEGMLSYNGSSWAAPTSPVCSSWTWGQPSRVLLPSESISMPATITLSAGQITSGVLQYDSTDNPSSLPAGGAGNQAVFNAPRVASLCPAPEGRCLPPWLNDKEAVSLESSCIASLFCYSGQSAPSIGYVSDGASFAQSRSASLAVVTPTASPTSFRTHIQDNDTGSASVTVTSLPSGTLSYCNPGCVVISSAPFTLPYSQTAPAQAGSLDYVEWSFTLSGSARTSMTVSVTDGSNSKTQRITFLPSASAGAAVSSLPLSQIANQGDTAVVYSIVQDLAGDNATSWSQDVTGTPNAVNESILSAATGWTAHSIEAPSATSGDYTLGWSLSSVTSKLQVKQHASVVTNNLDPFTVSQDDSLSPSGSVTVTDTSGAPVENYPVFFKVLRRGSSYIGAYATSPVCLTNASGMCSSPDVFVSYGADSGSGKIVAHIPSSQDDVSFSITPKAKFVSAGSVEITQGDASVVSVSVFDGHGESMPDASLTVIQGATPGLSFSPSSGTTDQTGSLSLTITATASRGVQRVEVLLNNAVRAFFSVTVVPSPAQVSVSTGSVSLSISQDSLSSVVVTVRDADGLTVPGASVATSCSSGAVLASSPVPSSQDGTVEIVLGLSNNASPGSLSCSVSSGTSTPVSINVEVSS